MGKQLYRSNRNKVIGGVCGGIAEYFDIDPTVIRLLWVLLTFPMAAGIIAYIICLIIIPERPAYGTGYYTEDVNAHCRETVSAEMEDARETPPTGRARTTDIGDRGRILTGVILIALGGILLARRWLYWLDLERLWPVLLIIGGFYVLFRGRGGE